VPVDKKKKNPVISDSYRPPEEKFPSGDRKPATRAFEMFTGLVGDMQRRLNTSSQVMTKR
jgi:hypothetical protein